MAAVLDEKGPRLSVPAAVQVAERGELPGCDPFRINVAYARDLVRKEERARAGEALKPQRSAHERLGMIQSRMATAFDASLRAYEARARAAAKSTKAKAPPVSELVQLARAGQEIAKLAGNLDPSRAIKPAPPSNRKAPAPNSQLEAMLAHHERTKGEAIPAQTAPASTAAAEHAPARGDVNIDPGTPDVYVHETPNENDGSERHALEGPPSSDQAQRDKEAARADFRRALAQLEASR